MSTYEKKLALYKNNKIRITQYGGMVRLKDGGEDYFDPDHQSDNDYVAMSHQGYRATDIAITITAEKKEELLETEDLEEFNENRLFAPFPVKCIFDDVFPNNPELTSDGCILSIFETIEKVYCPKDNQEHDLTLIVMHGGNEIEPVVGNVYNTGEHIYQMGIQGTVGGAHNHIHLEILPFKITGDNGTINWNTLFSKFKMEPQPYGVPVPVLSVIASQSWNLHEAFYNNGNIYFSPNIDYCWGQYINEFIPIPTHGFVTLGNNTYFYAAGNTVKGWFQRLNGDWYFFDYSSGIMKKGWVADGDKWYFLDYSTGIMRKYWVADGSNWYYLDPESGAMCTGLIELSDGIYYLHPTSGAMQTGWQTINGDTYYFTSSGAAATGYYGIDGVTYHFDDNGVLIS